MYYQLNLTIAIQVIFIKFSLALTVFHTVSLLPCDCECKLCIVLGGFNQCLLA